MVNVRPIKNARELDQAFSLSKSVFDDHTSNPDTRLKRLAWSIDDSLKYENVIVLIEKSLVIGLCRICPTYLTYDQEVFKVAGLSSICILKTKRGRGLSRLLMSYVNKLIDQRGYDFAYLVARRAADHFYNRFGFLGASSYPSVRILPSRRGNRTTTLIVKGFDSGNSEIYNQLYKTSYQYSFGASLRNKEFWKKVEKRIKIQNNLKFKEFLEDGKIVGYGIECDKKIVELGIGENAINQIIEYYVQEHKEVSILELLIPHSHNSLTNLEQFDIEFFSRKCLFGGHMLRWSKLETSKKLSFTIGIQNMLSGELKPQFSIGYLDEV